MSGIVDDFERLEEADEVDDFAFSVTNPQTGQAMKVYQDGQIDGFPSGFTLVINRIPTLTNKAAELGFSEAVARITDARRDMFMSMIGDFRKKSDGS